MLNHNQSTKNKYSQKPGHINTVQTIKNHGGSVVDYGMVEWDKLNIGPNRNHQTRDSEDKNHIKELQDDIAINGLNNIPIVEQDPGGRYNVLSGHHRLFASSRLGWKEFPVAVAHFPNIIGREKFMMDDQNHPPAKRHKGSEYRSHLERLDNMKAFSSCKDIQELEKQARKEIEPYCGKSQVTKVVKDWIANRGNSDIIRRLLPSDIKIHVSSLWPKVSPKEWKSGMTDPSCENNVLISSVPTAADKGIYNVMKKVHRDGIKREVEIAIHGQSNDKNGLIAERQKAEEDYRYHNISDSGNQVLIKKIHILPQTYKSGKIAENIVTKIWDSNQKNFI